MPCVSGPSYEDVQEDKRKALELKNELDLVTRLLCDIIAQNGGTAGLVRKAYQDDLNAWSKRHEEVDKLRIQRQKEKIKSLKAQLQAEAYQLKRREAEISSKIKAL